MNRKQIVHLVEKGELFYRNYIDFMKKYFPDYSHVFVCLKDSYYDTHDATDIFFLERWRDIGNHNTILNIMKESDLIIVSGLFGTRHALYRFPGSCFNKTYIQFWGGDFYFITEPHSILNPLYWYRKFSLYFFAKRCAGLLFLIDEEYLRFFNITGINNKNYVAPMPPNDAFISIPIKYRGISCHNGNIVLGNSATQTNNHIEMLNILARFNNINVYAPLSYGDNDYRDYVIKKGRELLGDRFFPMLDIMPFEKYVEFLSNMDIGVYNCDRQQAMGNIKIMLAMGKKVYLRDDTSMWTDFKSKGHILHSVTSLNECSGDEFLKIDENESRKNMEAYDAYDFMSDCSNKWAVFFHEIGLNSPIN